MTTQAGPSIAKIALGVAAGIILAAVVLVFGLTGIGAVAARNDAKQASTEANAFRECQAEAIRAAKTMQEVVEFTRPCEPLRDEYRGKWGKEP